MPRVTFVNEHRAVDAAAGVTVREVAAASGIALGSVCWVEPSDPGAVAPPSWLESLRGMRGWRRLPGHARVLGDVKVYSAPAAANRVDVARTIDPPPSPVADPAAPRKPDDAAPTAEHVRGHPLAIGRGAIGHGAPPPPPAPPESRSNAARPMPTEPPPAPVATEGEGTSPSK